MCPMSGRTLATLSTQAAAALTVGTILHRRQPTADHLVVQEEAKTVPLASIVILAGLLT